MIASHHEERIDARTRDLVVDLASPCSLARACIPSWIDAPHYPFLDELLTRIEVEPLRLILSAPPRHGKSHLMSWAFPLWYLIRWPNKRVIHISYETGFAIDVGSRRVRDSMAEHGPTYGVRPLGNSAANWQTEQSDALGHWRRTPEGGMRSVGMAGPITGKGADLLLVDDPVKNSLQAQSDVIRRRHIDWWDSTAYTRLEPHASIVIMQTRWHEADLSGSIVAKMLEQLGIDPEADIDKWHVVNLPAIAGANDPIGRQPGDPLWPDRYPLRALNRIRKRLSSYWWSALYQGSPHPDDGVYFRRSSFRYYERRGTGVVLHTPEGSRYVEIADMRLAVAFDTALEVGQDNDYTVAFIWGVLPWGDLLLWEVVRERLAVPDQWPFIVSILRRYKPARAGVERKASGHGLLQQAARDEHELTVELEEIEADVDKGQRATPLATAYVEGRVYHPVGAPWLDVVEHELLGFPNAAHDDIVDAGAHAHSLTDELVAVKAPSVDHLLEREDGVPEHYRPQPRGPYDQEP